MRLSSPCILIGTSFCFFVFQKWIVLVPLKASEGPATELKQKHRAVGNRELIYREWKEQHHRHQSKHVGFSIPVFHIPSSRWNSSMETLHATGLQHMAID